MALSPARSLFPVFGGAAVGASGGGVRVWFGLGFWSMVGLGLFLIENYMPKRWEAVSLL
jgi:hypothetical protein